jgi:NADPH:quinone reductase-like Zn-dependent oxidoreductase
MQQSAIRHHSFGKPLEVLQLEQIAQPEPQAGEVRVRLEVATINPSDYGMIGGSYGNLRELPAIAGREGVGVVEALGEGVDNIEVGARVRFPGENGAWQESACIAADQLLVVPAEVPVEQAAISFINPPTAYCLLKKVVDLQPGDWIVQNAGNSAVGLSVIQMAKVFGLKTISQVRREELVEPLKAMGADHVVLEGSGWAKGVSELTGGAPVRLALNSIGGESAIDQIKALGNGGTQVTFGGMVGDKVRFPTRFLIFNDVRLTGFWWDQYGRRNGVEAVREVMADVYKMMADGSVKLPIEKTYSFSEFKDAIQHDRQPRLGKILLKP